MINISRKVSLWLSVRSILEKQRMRLIAPGFRFRAHLRAGLWLGSGLSPPAFIDLPQMLVVENHITFKKQRPRVLYNNVLPTAIDFPLEEAGKYHESKLKQGFVK